jgi:hypothetical protein
LSEHFPGIVRGLVVVATLICNNPPSPYKKPLVYLLFQATRKKDLEKEEAEENKYLPYTIEEAFKEKFTDLFFQLMLFLKPKGKTNNYRLRQLAEEHLTERIHETYHIKHAIELFDKQKLTPEKKA